MGILSSRLDEWVMEGRLEREMWILSTLEDKDQIGKGESTGEEVWQQAWEVMPRNHPEPEDKESDGQKQGRVMFSKSTAF